MLTKLPLQCQPCQLLKMLSPLQSPQQPFRMGNNDHVLTRENQALGTDLGDQSGSRFRAHDWHLSPF